MKRRISLMLAVWIGIMGMLGAQASAGAPIPVRFDQARVNGYGGNDVILTVLAQTPVSETTRIAIQTPEGTQWAELAPGTTKAQVTLPTTRVTQGLWQSYDYTLTPGDGYTIAGSPTCTVVTYALPTFQFPVKDNVYIQYGGNTKRDVNVYCTKKDALYAVTSVELRTEDGAVLAQARYSKEYALQTFMVNFTDDMPLLTRAALWIGTQKVSEDCLLIRTVPTRVLRQVDRPDRKVSMTFDCGAGIAYAQEILDTLDAYQLKVTFFVTGDFVKTYPDTVREIVNRGHEIGNHSLNHLKLTESDDSTVYREIVGLNAMLSEFDIVPRFFRVPYGEYSRATCAVAESQNMITVQWIADSYDSFPTATATDVYYAATQKLTAGGIYLFHLAGEHTHTLLPSLIEYYQEHGYEIVPVSELLLTGDAYIDESGVMRAVTP